MTTTEEIAGKYRVIRMLGEGGMGQVFEAVNKNTERRVAIKTLHPRLAEDGAVVQRFLREARAATRVRHPNVVDVLDFDVDPVTKSPYLVQEFLVGDSLYDVLASKPGGRLGVDEALAIIVPVMSALVAAHAIGVVHRDLKPDNVFLVREGRGVVTPKLIDFGIAKVFEGQAEGMRMTQTGAVMGTPGYMSPEQAGGAADIDGRTDIWSVGVMLYELLVGVMPYEAPNYNILVAKILFEEPTPILQVDPGLRPEVAAVVQRALMRSRDARFATMQAMLDATLACVTDERVRTSATIEPPPPSPDPVQTPARAASAMGSDPTMAYGAAAAPVPTLGGWAGPPTPPRSPSNTRVVAAVVVAALLGGAMWFARSAPPSSSTAVLRAPVPHAATTAPPAPPVVPVVPVTSVTPTPEVAAPAPIAAPAPTAAPALAAPEAPAPAAPAVQTPPEARPRAAHAPHSRRRRPTGTTSTGSRDFDRGYPQ
ncbi:MAG: serine/threonine-protein kinase [Polyangiales bacterium]